ncbi:hypothetical protein Fmac_000472 [Flemingia macrophylla]|uniref:BHLH domain-containing protein n=1 Tax=Flemingia macrophylla TaxID=520843 RepID=A0ABD1NFM6_9FABA
MAMGPLGLEAFPGGEGDFFGKMLANEPHYWSPQDDGNRFCSTPDAGGNRNIFYSFDSHNSNFRHISLESSHNSNSRGHSDFMANPDHTNYHFGCLDHVLASSTSIGFCMIDEKNPGSSCVQSDIEMKDNVRLSGDLDSEGSCKSVSYDRTQVKDIYLPAKHLKLKRELDVSQLKVQHCMKNKKLDKNENQAEVSNGGGSSSSLTHTCTPEDDNASALNLKGKTKASRGSATDPQSLYARRRRERINERLRILQNLVPNGTEVDISSMLEEAVHYVKFLQLQIKLLSSDDLWMFAPIAYNGLDIVLNPAQQSSPPF